MASKTHRPITLGVIIGNRDFFPDGLITVARDEIIQKLTELQIKPILLPLDATKLGGVETWAYVGDGSFIDDPLDTFGSRAVVQVPGLQNLMQFVCKNGFEHHAAMTTAHAAAALHESFTTYFGWDTYWHGGVGYRLQVTSCGLQVTSCELRVARYGLRVSATRNSQLVTCNL